MVDPCGSTGVKIGVGIGIGIDPRNSDWGSPATGTSRRRVGAGSEAIRLCPRARFCVAASGASNWPKEVSNVECQCLTPLIPLATRGFETSGQEVLSFFGGTLAASELWNVMMRICWIARP